MIRNKIVLSTGSVILLFSLLVAMVGCSSPTTNSVASTQSTQSEAVSSSVSSAESETETSSLTSVGSAVSSSVSSAVSSAASKAAISSAAPKAVNKLKPSVSSSKPSSSKTQSSSSAITGSASSIASTASYTEAQNIANYKERVVTIMHKIDVIFNSDNDISISYDKYVGTKSQAMEFFNKLEAALLELKQLAAPQPYTKVQARFKQDCAQVISSCETYKKAISSSTNNSFPVAQQEELRTALELIMTGLYDISSARSDNNF